MNNFINRMKGSKMSDREHSQDRQWRDRDYYHDRDYYYDEHRFSPYRRGYGPEYDYQHPNYDYDYWRTPYDGWINGPYTGVGPRNYRRPDGRIKDDVNDRLTWHGYIDARDIDVAVDEGIVILNGTVESRRVKRLAEDVADSVSGVWDVDNNLKIAQVNLNMERDNQEEESPELAENPER